MTISWTFYNIPRGSEYFEAQLNPSVGDHIFSFNLAIHTPGEKNWRIASKDFTLGNRANSLKINGRRNQYLLFLVKDTKGTEKQIKFNISDRWVEGGNIGSTQEIVNYRKHFVDSLGITEDAMYCEALFGEYRELEAKTHIEVQELKRGQPYKLQPTSMNLQDLTRRKILAKELIEHCRDYFKEKPEEWYDLKMDARD